MNFLHTQSVWKHAVDSSWHNPYSFWILQLVLLFVVLRALGRSRTNSASGGDSASATVAPQQRHPLILFSLGFLLEIALDAGLTGNRSPLLATHSSWLSYVAIPFVILGDARLFWLCERTLQGSPRKELSRPQGVRWIVSAIALAFVVPVLQYIALRVAPGIFQDSRKLFLFYELLFFSMLIGYWLLRIKPRLLSIGESKAKWIRGLVLFVLVQYGLWASADILILLKFEPSFALRLIANTMYYGLFLPFAWFSVERSLLLTPLSVSSEKEARSL